jgi:hypothetical protein
MKKPIWLFHVEQFLQIGSFSLPFNHLAVGLLEMFHGPGADSAAVSPWLPPTTNIL